MELLQLKHFQYFFAEDGAFEIAKLLLRLEASSNQTINILINSGKLIDKNGEFITENRCVAIDIIIYDRQAKPSRFISAENDGVYMVYKDVSPSQLRGNQLTYR